MKIFVTVGTGSFDALVKRLDRPTTHDIEFQIGKGRYIPKHHRYFRFKPDLSQLFESADLIITHAGTGSIFEGLNMGKKMLVVPNRKRTDLHQLDIVRKFNASDYCMVCDDLARIDMDIAAVDEFNFRPYEKEGFGCMVEMIKGADL